MPERQWRFGLRRSEGIAAFAFRVSLLGVGLGALVFGVLAYPNLVAQTVSVVLLANQLLFGVVIGLPVALGASALAAPERLLRSLAMFYAVLYLVTLATWALFGTGQVDSAGDFWLLSVTAIPAASAMVGQPRPRTWLYLPVLGVLAALVAIRISSSPSAVWEGTITGLYDATFGAIFVGAVYVALEWTGRLDERITTEALAQTEALAEVARARERQRFEALVHDAVISTLLVAGRNAAAPDVLALQAEATLAQLAERVDDQVIDSPTLATRLCDAAVFLNPNAVWSAELSGVLEVSPSVADAFVGALTEAVRNAGRHAGQFTRSGEPITVSVAFSADESQIRVVIQDNGHGFDPHNISPVRMGVRGSIQGRMRTVGGSADVDSWPGIGSRVTLRWVAPQ